MKKWCHLPTGFNGRIVLQFVALALLIVALITTVIFARDADAVASTTRTISFQGRLQTAAGAVVADGYYNIQFKIYQDGTGTTTGNPGGSLKWTESYVNNNSTSGVMVKNGYFSVNLGSNNPFGSSVDWDHDTLWLSMNVAGSAANCTTFGGASCTADGEMLPMKQITATPYAINSGQLGGKTADNFVQLGQGVQQDVSTNSSSIAINKTGSGGSFLNLQADSQDLLNINREGNIEFGSQPNHSISIAQSDTDTAGNHLTITGGKGGDSTTGGTDGGYVTIRGGDAGGTGGTSGGVVIDAGTTSGGGTGTIYVGSSNNAGIQIGNTDLASGEQTIVIGTNANSGGTANVIIGAAGSSGGGTTKIQSKDSTTITTDGVDRATFDTSGNLYLGNGSQSNAPSDFRIQGTNSSASGVSGGTLTIQGGGATTGNSNGGNLLLSGGDSSGTGSKGLVVIDTPTYASASTQSSATSTTVTQSNIDSFGVVTLNATADNVAFTLGAPSLGASAAGRIVYVTAANGSHNYQLRANVGGGAGVEQTIAMKQNTTATMIWNGSLWTVAGSAGTTLQDAYNNSSQTTGDAQVVLNATTSPDGLTVRDSAADSVASTLLSVQTSSAATLFSVNSTTSELSMNPGAETTGSSGDESLQAGSWGSFGGATVSRQATTGDYIASGKGAIKIASTSANSGTWNQLTTALSPNTTYNMSFSVRLASGSLTDFAAYYLADGESQTATCVENETVLTSEWKRITCSFTTPASGMTSDNVIAMGQVAAGSHTYYIDNVSVTPSSSPSANVKVGSGVTGGPATLFQLDRSASAPSTSGGEAMLGSMYYDTTLGKVQCYEADGWGACGASPDTFVNLSPEYTNAVMHGSDQGTMTSDLCSDTLNINDGSSSQPTICGTNETYNYYKWTSAETSDQTRSVFVTYHLPSSFKNFVAGSTSLAGRTNNSDATVTYQIYKNNSSGLTACGSVISVSTGTQTAWQKVAASGSADPATCTFTAGDNIVVRVNLTAKNDANAYVSNLGFAFSNN